MILDLVPPYRAHEPCFRSCLDNRAIKGEMVRCSKIIDELRQRVTNIVSVHFLNCVGSLEPALVRVKLASDVATQGLEFPVCSISSKLPIEPHHAKHAIGTVTSTDRKDGGPYSSLSGHSERLLSA